MTHQLAVASIFKWETPYLLEWIEYHRLVGVDHFFLYDNDDESKSEVTDLLQPYCDEGIVTYNHQPGQAQQIPVDNKAIRQAEAEGYRWLALIDLDEFLYPMEGGSIVDVLGQFEERKRSRHGLEKLVGGIVVNWCPFGSSGHQTKPDMLQIEAYTHRVPDSFSGCRHVKSIVRPNCVYQFGNPHFAHYKKEVRVARRKKLPVCSVNTRGLIQPSFSAHLGPCFDRLRVNHYTNRSWEEFQDKIKKGRADVGGVGETRHKIWDDVEPYATVEDTGMLRFVPRVKERVASSEI